MRHQFNVNKLVDATAIRSHLVGAGAFKSTASELLTLAPVVAFYLATVALPHGFHLSVVTSMMAAFDALSLLQTVRHGCVTPEALRGVITRH